MAADTGTWAKFRKVIATTEPPLLGPLSRSGVLTIDQIDRAMDAFFKEAKVPARIQPDLRSTAFLWHDHLDASHTISQSIETRDGSWLHGIMHRREPDYGNAKYWFRRVGQHDAFAMLAAGAAKFLQNDGSGLAERLVENGQWMPFAFVDECKRAESRRDEQTRQLLRQIQALEFDVLVEHILNT